MPGLMHRRASRGSICGVLAFSLAGLLALLVLGWLSLTPVLFAAPGPGAAPFVQANAAADEEQERPVDGVFLPPDRTTRNRLEAAEKMLGEGRFGESVRYLGSLLDAPEDFFIKPGGNQSLFRSLKGEAARLLAQMPTEGRQSYELQFGASARKLLEEAASTGDASMIAEVSRRYFFTRAGGEATLLLARNYLDHGQSLASAVLLERLQKNAVGAEPLEPTLSLLLATSWLRAGHGDKAQAALLKLKKSRNIVEVVIAGKTVKMFSSDSAALEWLVKNVGKPSVPASSAARQWAMQRGDPARNSDSAGGIPLLNLRWRQQTVNDTKLQEMASQLRQGYQEQDIAVLPSMQPLAVGDVVLMRTAQRLQAVDFRTGKRIWRYPVDEPTSDEPQGAPQPQLFGQPQTPLSRLDDRLWDDTTFGTLSSDGVRVYCLEDLDLTPPSQNPANVLRNNNIRFQAQLMLRSTNRLAALELATEGKLQWRVGGPTGEDEPKLAGAYFLGPPLPLFGRLYVLAETRGQEIRLFVLSADTGRLEWSQQLAFVEDDIFEDESRHTAGLTPSYSDGVLICPTASGAVVAVDVSDRSLLWGYQYPRGEADDERLQRRGGMFQMGMANGNTGPRAADRWMDSTAIVAAGRVLVTPPESDDLYCLSLTDGQLAWKQKRGGNLYIGCVHDDKVLLVGHHQVSALNLADGKAAWKQPLILSSGETPSGRGFLSGGNYLLPLSTAEVAQVNISTGQIEQRAKARRGNVPGNLIAYRGHVISQSSDFVEVYSQLGAMRIEIAGALAQNPADAKALARQAELELHDARLSEALSLLRRSYQEDENIGTHDLLVETLLGALQQDFASNRQAATELEALIDQKHQRLAYLRLMCSGLQAAGEIDAALDMCLRVVDQESELASLDEIDGELTARRDRWIQARIGQLYAAGSADARARIERIAQERLDQAGTAQSAESLRRFLSCFGTLPLAEQAREQLVVRLLAGDPSLECELLLRRLEASKDPQRSRAATARLAQLLKEGKHPELAAVAYRKLAGELADVVCLNDKTGKQIFEELPKENPLRALIGPPYQWPSGQIEEKNGQAAKHVAINRAPQPPLDLEIRGDARPFFDDLTVSYEWPSQTLIAQDNLGHERFRLTMSGGRTVSNQNPFAYPQLNNASLNYVSSQGSMLALYLGHQIVAFDTQYNREVPSGLMWSQDLTEQMRSIATQGYRPKEVRTPWGGIVTVPADTSGRPVGLMGPLNQESLCFQHFKELVCVHPLTGKVQWTRKNVPSGSSLYGDDVVLIVAPPEGQEAILLSAVDGQFLGRREIPAFEQRMAGIGRNLLAWRTETGEPTLTLTDVLTGEDTWSFVVEPGVKAALIGIEEVAVMQPRTGKFNVIRIADGKPLVDVALEKERALASIIVTRSKEQYLVITDAVPEKPETDGRPYQQGVTRNRVVSGRMYAIDRATAKLQWKEPFAVKQQGIVTGQPLESPLYVFARHLQRATPNSPPQNKTSITCVDKRTGRSVDRDVPITGNGNNLEVQADPPSNTVSLILPGQTITYELTEKPWPPAGATDDKNSDKSVLKALQKGVNDTIKKLLPQPLGSQDKFFQDDD